MIKLNIHKDIFIPKFYKYLFDYENRFEIYYGSAGSGKSYFITQKIVLKALKDKRRVLVARRYGNTNRNSTFALFKIVLQDLGLIEYCNIRETDMRIKLPNNSEILFTGLDSEEKLLSLTDISDVWVEETYEISQEMLDQLNLRMRGKASNQQIFVSFNPISINHWLHDFTKVNPPESSIIHHSTYKDNPFLGEDYVAALDEMEERNPQKYRIYGLGQFGVDSGGLVFQDWRLEEFNEMELAAKRYEHRVGFDIGFIDPSAIVATLYDKENKTIYIYDEYYKTGAQLSDLKDALIKMKLQKAKVYCDSADARAIAYFRQFGLNVVASKKGAGSVNTGIAFIQDHRLVIHPRCKEVIREIENYSYIKNRDGQWTNDTTKDYDHSMDALRYAFSDIYTENKMTTMNKSALGL